MSPATVVFVGGPVHCMATPEPTAPAEAVAVEGDRIVAVGPADDVLDLRGPGTEVVDLEGQALLPGLIDPHTHPDLCAQCYSWADVSGFTHRDVAGVEAALREAIHGAGAGEWVFAFGLDPILTADLGIWGRDRLDAMAPDNPVAVMIQSMHTLFVNSRALAVAGVDEATPDPGHGGRFQRDEDGRLTGKIEEAPAEEVFLRFFDQSADALRARLGVQYERYAEVGITTLGMPGLFVPLAHLDVFEQLARRDDHPLRTVAYLRHHQTDRLGRTPGSGTDRFAIQGVKLWYGGSPYSGTMLLDEPYLESNLCCCTLGIPAGTRGHANFDPDELRELLGELLRGGWQVLTHAQGDRGTRETLALYRDVLHDNPDVADHRWRIEHCALISADDLERSVALGVTPSFHVNHIHYYGNALRDEIIGPERAERLMPVGTAVECGHRVSLHADSPMYPPGPLGLVQTAVTRRSRSGSSIGPGEAIDVHQGLRAVTIDAAWQLCADDRVGSIEPGKLADLAVLEADPFEVDPASLGSLAVTGTWLGGRPV